MQIKQRDEVDFDLAEIATWYERRQPELGQKFLREFQRAVDWIADNPLAWPRVRGREARKYLIRQFGVFVIYGLLPDGFEILVVVDAKRSPKSWMHRLDD